VSIALLADEMLGKLARDLRILGYDVAYERDVRDEVLLERARREGRLLVTRDRRLAARAGEAGVLLETRDPGEQLARLVDRLGLAPEPEAFLSRCLQCNALLETADRPAEVPADIEAEAHYACPGCEKVYWRGTHAEDMVDRLGDYVPDADRETLLDPLAGDDRKA